jgi:hypothetical protein
LQFSCFQTYSELIQRVVLNQLQEDHQEVEKNEQILISVFINLSIVERWVKSSVSDSVWCMSIVPVHVLSHSHSLLFMHQRVSAQLKSK